MNKFTFYKQDSKWYIDLPDWQGDLADLEMVMGADTLLDVISKGENRVELTLSQSEFDSTYELTFVNEAYEGAVYSVKGADELEECWLCEVTKFVFGNYPSKLYIS